MGDLSGLPTPEGFVVNCENITGLIEVSNGSYEESLTVIDVISNFLLFLPVKVLLPKTGEIERLAGLYKEHWSSGNGEFDAVQDVKERVMGIKACLLDSGKITADGDLRPVVDFGTSEVVKMIVFGSSRGRNQDLCITPKIYQRLIGMK
jgi:hypothetical protein